MQQAHLFISGFVQGIGYRQFVKSNAQRLGLTGWVRNLSDGRVETLVQGEKKNIEELIVLCKTGPMLAEVKDMEVEWIQDQEKFSDFEVRP